MSADARTAPRTAFTLVEMLVVVAILALLAGMLMPVVIGVRKRQRLAAARTLLAECGAAVERYIGDYGILGDDRGASATGFAAAPMEYLVARPTRTRVPPYLQIGAGRLVRGVGVYAVCMPADAEFLLDPFAHPLAFEADNGERRGVAGVYDHVRAVRIRCAAGTPGEPADDLMYTWDVEKGGWAFVAVAGP